MTELQLSGDWEEQRSYQDDTIVVTRNNTAFVRFIEVEEKVRIGGSITVEGEELLMKTQDFRCSLDDMIERINSRGMEEILRYCEWHTMDEAREELRK